MTTWIGDPDQEIARYRAAERFVEWLERRVMIEARGDDETFSHVDPTGRFWLGRLGPKDFVTRPDERQDRLEPCAIGLRIRPATSFPLSFEVRISCRLWKRRRADDGGGLRWAWDKTEPMVANFPIVVEDRLGDQIFGAEAITDALVAIGAAGLSGDVRVRMTGRTPSSGALEITFVNTSQEVADYADGRFFEAELEVIGLQRLPFQLETLPDSFRYDRHVQAYGINCGFVIDDHGAIRTSDGPAYAKERPTFWPSTDPKPDLTFAGLARNPIESARALLCSFENWASDVWSDAVIARRAESEGWSEGMRQEASEAQVEFRSELERIRSGVVALEADQNLRTSFQLMNRAMGLSAAGKYEEWRPFQLAFLLANLQCLVDPLAEAEIVDIVWFATGGGKTETYLGLLLTAAFLDRKRGKISGITAWSRFPLRLLSLQQTQRFANALAAAEMVRREAGLAGDPFSLGFLVGGAATPNRILKDASQRGIDADSLEEKHNPYLLLDRCPFCRERTVTTEFDRLLWRLDHICSNSACPTAGAPLPIHVIDDEIWRFLPTIVIGTLDKAANISRQTGMRGLVASPHGKCTVEGHGYTYATRSMFPNGCFVPDCPGGPPGPLPMAPALYPVSFRLQDELHLLRDSLGAVDAHYECALDGC